MTWPTEIYVATGALGVYYTGNFVHPDTQPVWAAVNTGLANIGCREFKLDPFHPSDKQYVLTESDRILYRRDNQGSWASILTPAQVDTLLSTSGCSIGGFCTDVSTQGRLWALVGSPGPVTTPQGYWAIYSDNYGVSWTAVTKIHHDRYFTYGMHAIRAYGINVWVSINVGGNTAQVRYSYNKGSSWEYISLGFGVAYLHHNPLIPDRLYFSKQSEGVLYRLDAGSVTATSGYCGDDHDLMWFDAADVDHQRAIYQGKLLVTEDGWDTYSEVTPLDLGVEGISYYSGGGEQMLVACHITGSPVQNHVIGAMTGEVTTVTGIAGAMAGTSPYTDSIPNTCEEACLDGVQGIWHVPSQNIYSYDVLFESEPAGSAVYPYGVDFGEDGAGNSVLVQSVEME